MVTVLVNTYTNQNFDKFIPESCNAPNSTEWDKVINKHTSNSGKPSFNTGKAMPSKNELSIIKSRIHCMSHKV